MEWKAIPRFNGLYLISENGEVFSTRTNRILKQQLSNVGYYRVEINIDGNAKRYGVHRLVAETFIPNPENLPVVNHKDENPKNNNVCNLEWCTHQYNQNYGTCKERRVANTDYKTGSDNAKSKTVYQFDLQGNFIKSYGSTHEAERETGFSAVSISKCCSGKLKQYAGFGWSYTKEYLYNADMKRSFRKGNILQYDMQGNLVKVWDDPKELENAGFRQISVNRVCRGERNSYKGYVFKHEVSE